jgi:hypothetical protein
MSKPIIKGEDNELTLNIVNKFRRPYDLTGWTKISVFFKKADGGVLEKNTVIYNTKAEALYLGITFTAVTSGTAGNSISLVFDGLLTIGMVVDAWNLANPSNKVAHNGNNGSVLAAGTVNLANAQDGLLDVLVPLDVLGSIKVMLHDFDSKYLLAGRSITFKVVIDKGSPPQGERRKVMFRNALDIEEDNI